MIGLTSFKSGSAAMAAFAFTVNSKSGLIAGRVSRSGGAASSFEPKLVEIPTTQQVRIGHP
jgi:hypothetical protein